MSVPERIVELRGKSGGKCKILHSMINTIFINLDAHLHQKIHKNIFYQTGREIAIVWWWRRGSQCVCKRKKSLERSPTLPEKKSEKVKLHCCCFRKYFRMRLWQFVCLTTVGARKRMMSSSAAVAALLMLRFSVANLNNRCDWLMQLFV